MRHWRKMTWTILVWTGLMVAWAVSAGGGSADCASESTYVEACKTGEAAGRGIAVFLIGFVWFVGFLILSIVWFMTKPKDQVVVYAPAPTTEESA